MSEDNVEWLKERKKLFATIKRRKPVSEKKFKLFRLEVLENRGDSGFYVRAAKTPKGSLEGRRMVVAKDALVSLSLTDEEVLEVAVKCDVFIDDPSDWMANDYKKERILIFAKELLLSALQGH